jgi:1,4-dihydroxy-2-naphthoate octaprenyltransferase
VVLGKRRARWGYLLLLAAAFGLTLYWFVTGIFPVGALLILGGVPLAVFASRILLREYDQRSLVRANALTIQLQLVSGLLMALGIFLSARFFS